MPAVNGSLALGPTVDALIEIARGKTNPRLTFKGFTILLLLLREGPLMVRDIAKWLQLDKAVAWRSVDSLKADQLLEQISVTDENDQRVHFQFAISAKGVSLVRGFVL